MIARGDHFRVIARHRGGDHHRIGARDIFGGVRMLNGGTQTRQALRHHVIREIRTGHDVVLIQQHLGNPAHARAADADEVDVFYCVPHDRILIACVACVGIRRPSRTFASRKREPCLLLTAIIPTEWMWFTACLITHSPAWIF